MFLNLPHSCYLVSHFLYFIVNLCLLVIFSYNTSVNWRCKETIKRNKATEFPVFLCKLIVIFFFRNKSLFVKNKMNALCKHAIWNTVDPIVVHPNNLLWLWFLTALDFTSCVVGVHSGGGFGAPNRTSCSCRTQENRVCQQRSSFGMVWELWRRLLNAEMSPCTSSSPEKTVQTVLCYQSCLEKNKSWFYVYMWPKHTLSASILSKY